MKFSTRLESTADISIYGLGEYDEVLGAEFVIEWEVDIETREWGIKNFTPRIINVFGEYDVETYDEKGDVVKTETIKFDFEPYREKAKFEAEFAYNSLSISDIEIDVQAKTLEVS